MDPGAAGVQCGPRGGGAIGDAQVGALRTWCTYLSCLIFFGWSKAMDCSFFSQDSYMLKVFPELNACEIRSRRMALGMDLLALHLPLGNVVNRDLICIP